MTLDAAHIMTLEVSTLDDPMRIPCYDPIRVDEYNTKGNCGSRARGRSRVWLYKHLGLVGLKVHVLLATLCVLQKQRSEGRLLECCVRCKVVYAVPVGAV
jgi:hypothetical protein